MYDSVIRTVVPLVVTLILGWAAKVGLGLPSDALTIVVTAVIGFVYYTVARVVEQRWPAWGSALLALGMTTRQPTYMRDVEPPRDSQVGGPA